MKLCKNCAHYRKPWFFADEKIERALSEALEQNGRGWLLEQLGAVRDRGLEHLHDAVGVAPVGDPHPDNHPIDRIRKCPVHQGPGNELFVGNHEFLTIPVGDGGGPDLDP